MPLVVNCAGCDRPINDQYLYNVLDRAWHQSCIQCTDCKSSLNEKCFSRDGKLFCKDDFFRRYGPKCAGCNHGISPADLVRRARDKVYHINCFACCVCRKPIGTGEQLFFVDEYKFMCKQDYVLNKPLAQDDLDEDQCLLKSPINNSQLNLYDSSTSSVSSTNSDQRNLKFLQNHHSMHHMHPLDSISSSSSSSPSLLKQDLNQTENNTNFHPSNTSTPPLGKQNTSSQLYIDHAAEKENLLINTSNDSSSDFMHMTNNYHISHMNSMHVHNSQNFYPDFMDSDKDENNNSDDELIDDDDDDVDEDEEDEDGNGDRTHGSNGKSSSSSKDDSNNLNGKKRGPRTTIKAKQLEMLKSAFAATPKPTRHIREQLAQETGLNMRVIQVWFQNRRSKERRMKQLSAMGNRRHYYRNSAAAAAAAARLQQNQPANNQNIPIPTPQMTSSLAPTQTQRPYDIEQTEYTNTTSNQTNYMNHTTDFYGNSSSYEFMVQNNENMIPRPYDSVLNPVMESWNMI